MAKYKFEIYTSLITRSHLYIKGRLIRDWGFKSSPTHGMLESLFVSLMRAWTRELKFVPLKLYTGVQEFPANTDEEGYFELFIERNKIQGLPDQVIIEAEVKGVRLAKTQPLRFYPEKAGRGIISDIDDTILITRVKSFFKLKMLFNTLFINPFRRKPIENAAEFYRQSVKTECGDGPIIYLSNSPWNLYDYLTSFLNHNDFPRGEIQLRDFGLHTFRRKKQLDEYNKYREAEKMMQVFSNTKFMLVGDSAEKDFDIYSKLKNKYPDRVSKVVLIKAGNSKNELRIGEWLSNQEIANMIVVDSYADLL